MKANKYNEILNGKVRGGPVVLRAGSQPPGGLLKSRSGIVYNNFYLRLLP